MREVRPTVKASAPVRLDFAGGWTDVEPFSLREGGAVVNAAISLRVHAEFQPGGENLLIRAADTNEAAVVRGAMDLMPGNGLELHRAAIRMLPVGGGTLRTRSEAPPGSGLGSSGALDVALLAVLAAARSEEIAPCDLAELGYELEAVEAGIAGGRQDQYAAALGGFHRLGFRGSETQVEPLQLEPEFIDELECRTLICYTGRSRMSGDTISRVMGAYEQGDVDVTGALVELAGLADLMAAALRAGDLSLVGRLLSANWACQQRLDAAMCTPEMRTLEQAMRSVGAIGGKAAGAGAGGVMFFVMTDDRVSAIERAEACGARVLQATFTGTGVETC
jgi:D-glycero-alpha-D-manno-heptose-7-phosphate kinase